MCLEKEEVVSRIGRKVFIKSEIFSQDGYFTLKKDRFNPLYKGILYRAEENNQQISEEKIKSLYTSIDKDVRNGNIAPWDKYTNWTQSTIKENGFYIFNDEEDARSYLEQLKQLTSKEEIELIRPQKEQFIIKKVYCEMILTQGIQIRPKDTWQDPNGNQVEEYIDKGYPAFTCKKMKIVK